MEQEKCGSGPGIQITQFFTLFVSLFFEGPNRTREQKRKKKAIRGERDCFIE
jgi:hypothetical protein